MNDKEIQKKSDNQESDKSMWSYCPICGNKLPQIQKVKFCMKCGTNIDFIREYRKLPPNQVANPYKITTAQPQYPPSFIDYGPAKISDDQILNTKDRKLWNTVTSIGLPLGSFIALELLLAGLFVVIIFLTNSLDALYGLISNSYFTILISLFEVLFIIFPLFYAGKYLENPTIKNRLTLLGFTSKGYERKKIRKEVLIGLGFSVIGYIVVISISILIEVILESGFGIEIVTDDSSIIPPDILSLILLVIVMILIVGTSEEILFRGFMQKGLVRNLGNRWGIIITAFIFSIIHLIGIFLIVESPIIIFISFIVYFLPYFAISLILGWLYYWRDENLIANSICHGFYNALTIVLAYIFMTIF